MGVGLPEDVVQFLAANMKSNIRELEGSLVRLGAYCSLTGQAITMDMAKTVLRDIIGEKKKIIAMDDIEEAVASRFHVKIAELKSRRRSKTLVYPRQIAMYLCREMTDSSFPEIGWHFGGKICSTTMYGDSYVLGYPAAARTMTISGPIEKLLDGQRGKGWPPKPASRAQ